VDLPDFYNPIGYSILKRQWLIRQFPGIEDVQVNFSQLHQDMFVLCLLEGKRAGSYLEIGANEPMFMSNTYLLESAFGWRGVGLELDAGMVERHRRTRRNPCHLQDACSADYDALLTAAGLGRVIDYLSVDADPAEVTLAALKRIPHELYRFRVITFEHDFSAGGARAHREPRLPAFARLSAGGERRRVERLDRRGLVGSSRARRRRDRRGTDLQRRSSS
jgi:hypothetical protein